MSLHYQDASAEAETGQTQWANLVCLVLPDDEVSEANTLIKVVAIA